MILPALDVRRPFRAFFACFSILAVVVTVAFSLIVFWPDSSISQTLFGYFASMDGQEGFFQSQSIGGLEVPWIYFSSTPFLVPAFVDYLFINRIWRAAVILLALGVTFSKAGLSIAFAFGGVYAVTALFKGAATTVSHGARTELLQRFRRFLPAAVVAGVGFLIFLSLPAFLDQITDSWAETRSQLRYGSGTFARSWIYS